MADPLEFLGQLSPQTWEQAPTPDALPRHEAEPSSPEWSATPFREVELLGAGGMGAVFRARDLRSGREVALKLLKCDDAPRRARFRREGELAARLDHPNVVRVHELYPLAKGAHLLVTELVVGARPLDQAWRGEPLAQRLAWLLAAARGVAAAHAAGIVHRDLKPDNVLVDASGVVRVSDFGVAFAQDLDRLTQTGGLVGTPSCMSPEQFRGQPPSPRADVWALGILLYLALCDELPFQGANLAQLACAVERGLSRPQARALRHAPPALVDLVQRSLHQDPAQRPQHGAAFADELAGCLTDSRPRRAALPLALGVLACLGLGLAAFGPQVVRSPSPAPASSTRASPAGASAASARAAELEQALRELAEGSPRRAASSLRSLRPPLRPRELAPLRRRLIADALRADFGSEELRDRLSRLATSAALLPSGQRGRLEAPLVDRVARATLSDPPRLEPAESYRLLASLADLGARAGERKVALQLASHVFERASMGDLPPSASGRWFLLLLRLDVPTPYLSSDQVLAALRGGSPDEDWRRFLELRSAPRTQEACRRLRELLQGPVGERFGPRQSADALARAFAAQPPAAAVPALEAALERDPGSVSALTELALAHSRAGRLAQTRAAAERCVAAMERHGYPEGTATRNSYGRRLHHLAAALAAVEAWEDARRLVRLGERYPSSMRWRVLERFPRLARPPQPPK